MAINGPEIPLRDNPLDPLDPVDVITARILRELETFPDREFQRRHRDGLTSPKEISRVIAKVMWDGRL